MAAVVRFWLDCGVDGFRVDVIRDLLKDEVFRASSGRVLIGEIEYGSSVERLAQLYGDGDELHLALIFSLMTLPWQSSVIVYHLAL